MIITRSPLRITLGGGGTDLPSYYHEHGGFLISAAINKYVYITIHPRFIPQILLKYSKLEEVNTANEINHPLIRECLRLTDCLSYIEITSMADVPAGTGLGSSGSFITALLKALYAYKKEHLQTNQLAELACSIEIDILKEPVGKQDQYIAAFGGVTSFNIDKNGEVSVSSMNLDYDTMANLEENLMLFFTGYSRSASKILKEQDDKSKISDSTMIDNLHFVKDLGLKSKEALETGNLSLFAELMNVHWRFKKERSGQMSNTTIDEVYDYAIKNGALGGKLVGAGGGGFLMFYAGDKVKLRRAMRDMGLRELRFSFDFEGTKVLIS